MKKIAIIGYGYVGKAMAKFFRGKYELCIFDPFYPEDVSDHPDLFLKYDGDLSRSTVNSCDLSVICVPTPANEDGSCNIDQLKNVMEWVNTPLILIKSTIPVGTTDALKEQYGKRIVFSPEYCGESSYWTPYAFHTDIKETPFFVFGGDPKDTSELVDFFLVVAGPVKRYIQCEAKVAEMAKYVENTFYATKITYCYEIAEICAKMGLDWNSVREVWLSDPRINPMHTAVFKGNASPFSGKCLPKDLKSLVDQSKKNGFEPKLLQAVLDENERLKKLREPR